MVCRNILQNYSLKTIRAHEFTMSQFIMFERYSEMNIDLCHASLTYALHKER